MSISGTEKKLDQKGKHYLRAIITTAALSAFCSLFTVVYYQFSHYVYSDYMTFMFLIPFFGGTVVYLVLFIIREHIITSRLAFNLNNSGLAMLTVGCCFVGILEIAGGDSPYVPAFFIGGIAFCVAALAAFITAQILSMRNNNIKIKGLRRSSLAK